MAWQGLKAGYTLLMLGLAGLAFLTMLTGYYIPFWWIDCNSTLYCVAGAMFYYATASGLASIGLLKGNRLTVATSGYVAVVPLILVLARTGLFEPLLSVINASPLTATTIVFISGTVLLFLGIGIASISKLATSLPLILFALTDLYYSLVGSITLFPGVIAVLEGSTLILAALGPAYSALAVPQTPATPIPQQPASSGVSKVRPSHSVVSKPTPPNVPPNKLLAGRYLLKKKIGEGAYGEVWEAEDVEKGDIYAVKKLMPVGNKPPSNKELKEFHKDIDVFINDLRKELTENLLDKVLPQRIAKSMGVKDSSSITKELRNYKKNIIKIVDFNSRPYMAVSCDESKPYYTSIESYERDPVFVVMEYADLGDLGKVENRNELIKKKILHKVMLKVAGALAYYFVLTEGRGVHRDIKPKNILLKNVSGGIEPILTDFGTATYLGYRNERWVVGTPWYMPPEYLLYPGRPITPLFDVYSFGITYYEVLTGDIPLIQYGFIAISKHKLLRTEGAGVQKRALDTVNRYELALGLPTNTIINELEKLVYPPKLKLDKRVGAIAEQNKALESIETALTNPKSGLKAIYDKDVEGLREAVRNTGVPEGIADIILECINPNPLKRPVNMLIVWLKLRRV